MVTRRRHIYRLIASCVLLFMSVSGMRCGGVLSTPSVVSTTDSTTTNANVFVDVAVAGKFACGLDGAGRVYCWGGDGTIFENSITPTQITVAPSTKYIQKAYSGICGVTTAEDAYWCVGPGVYGPNASGTYTFASPFSISFSMMFGGTRTLFENDSNTMCAIDGSNNGQCWGFNNSGQFGSGDTTTSFAPVGISGSNTFTKIAPGGSASCGIIASGGGTGNVKCWGNGSDGLIGDGTWTASQLTPAAKVTLTGSGIATDVAAGGNHFCAVGSAGDVQCWGDNSNGQLGDNLSSGASSNTPRPAGSLTTTTAVRSAVSTSIAILQDGTLQCWGTNTNGAFGIGNTTPSASPVACGTGLANIQELSMNSDGGAMTVCALTTDGTIFCWGDNTYGQTGLAAGTATQSPGPELVHP